MSAPSYLPGWDNRARIIIDHSKIDAALVDFPVAIPISASCGIGDQDLSAIFDELTSDANRTKIAITTDDGQTQCYVEIENWDDANELAMLHVKVPSISADEDTVLYLYYDAEQAANTDYVGDTGDAVAQGVWDSDFAGVWHLAQDPSGGADAIKDSTLNGNHGTSIGTMLTEDLVDGLNGAKAIDFDGSDDHIDCGDSSTLNVLGDYCLEAILEAHSTPNNEVIAGRYDDGAADGTCLRFSDGELIGVYHFDVGVGYNDPVSAQYTSGTKYAATVFETGVGSKLRVNDTQEDFDGTCTTALQTSTQNFFIGGQDHGSNQREFAGEIGEVRLSDVIRSDAWLKATYHTLFDTLLSWQITPFDNRFKIVIDHSKIDADLTDFPVMINISDDSGQGGADLTAIFDELTTDAERVKIAVTASDGLTQCPVEIEYWDVASETAVLHVKVPAVDDDISTVLYLYYDADAEDNTDFVGDTGDAIAQSVWDDDFEGVFHFAQDPTSGTDVVLDSTSNEYHGDAVGTMTTADLVEGCAGARALEFDGSDDAIEFSNYAAWSPGGGAFCVEGIALTSKDHAALQGRIFSDYGTDTDNLVALGLQTDNKLLGYYRDGSANNIDANGQGVALNDGEWFHMAWVRTAATTAEAYVNGANIQSPTNGSCGTIALETGEGPRIGCWDSGVGNTNPWEGKIGEIRISSDTRSAAWIKATYKTLFDKILSYGTTLGYLPGFKNRVAIDIDNTLIDADLEDFPVMIRLGSAAGISGLDTRRVFEQLQIDGNNKKIAITTADGLTQCNVEIESWSQADNEAVLHVKVPHVDSSADTRLYLYFDNSAADNDSFVGDTGDAVAQGVWDANFVGVWHLHLLGDGTPTILEATVTEAHAGGYGGITDADLVDSLVGKGYDFSGGGQDRIYVGAPAAFDISGDITFEGVHKPDNAGEGNFGRIFDKNTDYGFYISNDGGQPKMSVILEGITGSTFYTDAPHSEYGEYTYWGFSRDKSEAEHIYSIDGVAVAGESAAGTSAENITTVGARIDIGNRYASGTWNRTYDGIIDEIRISNSSRSAAWLKATYHTLFDTLITFSDFESSEFKKRRKITIDSSLIDATLTDFPLAIPLGTTAGIGDEDLSDLFAELKFPASDPFFGGSAFDTTRWEIMGQAGNVTMNGNALQCYADSGDTAGERQGVLSKFKLDYTEDFDIRVDFEITSGPATNYWGALLEVYFYDQAGGSVGGPPSWDTAANIQRAWATAQGHKITANIVEDGSWGTADHDVTAATKGRLRLTFDASDPSFTSYYDVGEGWVALDEQVLTDVDATDALVCLAVNTGDSDPTVTAKFTNFDIITGTVKWPDGEPNRKKIKVTLDDLTTECPVEIEHLDVDGQTGILHTKIPYISSTVDTDIYLHYDCDQPDNANVGDTGDAIAQEVWDNDFAAVYHVAQDPSGGADCISDSTSNGNDGTPGGTMLTEDLVDGLNGAKAIDLEGTDDCVSLPAIYAEDPSSFTAEIVFKSDVSNTTEQRIFSYNEEGFYYRIAVNDGTAGKVEGIVNETGATDIESSDTGITVTDYMHLALIAEENSNVELFINSVSAGVSAIATFAEVATVGRYLGSNRAGSAQFADGIIGEVRLSSTVRSDAWIKATYHTLFDTLLTWDDAAGAWLGTWGQRRKFTIDYTLFDEELRDFPVALPIDASCGIGADDLSGLFTEVSTGDKKKMAVTIGDKVTECYFEIENWDSTNSKGILHTKIPRLELGKDTEVYLYYDSAQDDNARAGVPGDAIAAYVWDADFVFVAHLAEDPDGDVVDSIKDSTSNGNDGTPGGTMLTADLVDGHIGGAKAIDFDGIDDFINVLAYKCIGGSQNRSTELIFKAPAMTTTIRRMLSWGDETTSGEKWHVRLQHSGESPAGSFRQELQGAECHNSVEGSDDDAWHYGAATLEGTTQGDIRLNVDGVEVAETYASPTQAVDTDIIGGRDLKLGRGYNDPGIWEYFVGQIGEVRISDEARSAAWIKATYETLFDTFGTWSAEETDPDAVEGGEDIYVIMEAPAEITYSIPAAVVSVGIDMGVPAEITYTPQPATIGVGIDVGTPEITYSVPGSTVVQNLNAIGIMSKPNVSAKKPSATVTAKQPSITATGKKPSITATAKGD